MRALVPDCLVIVVRALLNLVHLLLVVLLHVDLDAVDVYVAQIEGGLSINTLRKCNLSGIVMRTVHRDINDTANFLEVVVEISLSDGTHF